MPWIVSVVLGGLMQIMGSLIGRALLALGFGFVEYVGISALVDSAKGTALEMIQGAGASVLADWVGFFRIDQHVSIIISAIGVKVLMSTLGGDKVRRLVQK